MNNERRAGHRHVVVAQLNRVSSGLERRVENLVDLIVLCDDLAGNIFAFRIGNGARQLAGVNLMTQLAHVNLEVCLSIHHDACKLRREEKYLRLVSQLKCDKAFHNHNSNAMTLLISQRLFTIALRSSCQMWKLEKIN